MVHVDIAARWCLLMYGFQEYKHTAYPGDAIFVKSSILKGPEFFFSWFLISCPKYLALIRGA